MLKQTKKAEITCGQATSPPWGLDDGGGGGGGAGAGREAGTLCGPSPAAWGCPLVRAPGCIVIVRARTRCRRRVHAERVGRVAEPAQLSFRLRAGPDASCLLSKERAPEIGDCSRRRSAALLHQQRRAAAETGRCVYAVKASKLFGMWLRRQAAEVKMETPAR